MILKKSIAVTIVLTALLLLGCSSDSSSSDTSPSPSTPLSSTNTEEYGDEVLDPTSSSTFVSNYSPNEGRLLASQCSQCHGTNGVSTNGWDSIAGEGNLHHEMFEDDAPIMLAQARGYSSAEISLIENYLTQFPEVEGDGYENDEEDEDEEDDD